MSINIPMMRHAAILIITSIFSFLAIGCMEKDGSFPTGISPEVISPAGHGELKKVFASHGYAWNTLESGVPHIIIEKLPNDLDTIPGINEKKRIFFLSLLPMVLMANEEILEKREQLEGLLRLYGSGISLDSGQLATVASLTREYGLEGDPLTNAAVRRELMRRIDVVPPSMALAQAATESAYGTSRFALEGNNLFGEWTFAPGTGLVPKERPEGEIYEVRRFGNLNESVKSYMKNLNTHRAYRTFREQRAHLRAAGLPLQGMSLARGLKNYSTRKEEYVEEIRAIIRRNHLSVLASAILRKDTSSRSPASSPSGAGLLTSLRGSRIPTVGENP